MDPAVSFNGLALTPEDPFVVALTEDADTLARQATRVLSDDFRRRLHMVEEAVAGMSQAEREGVADWLGAMLHRPPLEKPSRAWLPMRNLVESLWWEIAHRTPADPQDPDAGNERLVPNHPWGEGSES